VAPSGPGWWFNRQMASPEPLARKARGRPRKAGAEERIFDAALEEYGERGWAGFTMDAVARRAGVGKSTVYLRWQDKDSLLTAAVGARSGVIEDVDTGSFRGDLEGLAGNLFRYLLDPIGWATLRISVDAAGAPEPLGRFTDAVTELHHSGASVIFARGAARGDLGPDVRKDALADCLYGAVIMQTLGLSGDSRRLSDEDIAERVRVLVDFVLCGAG
jgi:AcrR family transcriptional regulator